MKSKRVLRTFSNIPHGCRFFLTTIWHTGTHTFRQGLLRKHGIRFRHVDEDALEIAKEADVIGTTYRDPYRTAASWYNRGKLQEAEWLKQWQYYKAILDMDPLIFYCDGPEEQHGIKCRKKLNSSPDTFKLHEALDNCDYKTFYQYVPKHLIEYSLSVCLDHPILTADRENLYQQRPLS